MRENKLVGLRKRLEEAKSKLASLEGERKALLARLKKEYGVEGVVQAEEKMKELESSIKVKEKRRVVLLSKIEKGLDDMEQQLEEIKYGEE